MEYWPAKTIDVIGYKISYCQIFQGVFGGLLFMIIFYIIFSTHLELRKEHK